MFLIDVVPQVKVNGQYYSFTRCMDPLVLSYYLNHMLENNSLDKLVDHSSLIYCGPTVSKIVFIFLLKKLNQF